MASATATAPTSTPRAERGPDLKDGDLALWSEKLPSGKLVYKIAEGKKDEKKLYTDVYPTINGVTLDKREALELYKGNSLRVEMAGQNGPYDVTLTKRAIEERPWKQNPDKVDRVMTVAMVFDLTKKESGEQYGYQIDGIRMFNTVGKDADKTKLEPQDAMRLLNGETLKLGNLSVKLDRVEEEVHAGKTQRTARVSAIKGEQESLPTDRQTVGQESPRPRVRM